MGFRIGEVRGFKVSGSKIKGFSQVVDFGNPEKIAKIKQKYPETIRSCKPLDLENDFENVDVNFLDKDVFEKQGNK